LDGLAKGLQRNAKKTRTDKKKAREHQRKEGEWRNLIPRHRPFSATEKKPIRKKTFQDDGK